ncbi:peptide/nickel transport system permease protein [Sphaerochaeta associata]|uniref:ABC transporter permease n=1 Tax=Sphaerochaeta associata TaxID=1129264 RepID=A0ABY4D8T1_9SPIR|nr:ABC transporter permease [Sphaerochaeta associata]UOM50701.1 ABC transporter permease [Sphaerochaeta associata]SMP39496.1 peptide/nickel transport system permease protein [Sphaerochaeta associata]
MSRNSNSKAIIKRLMKNKAAMFGLALFVILIFLSLVSPFIMKYSYFEMNPSAMLEGPSWEHPFGTDDLGRDVLSRILYGGRYSLSIGISSVVVALSISMVVGSIAGYFGGKIDNIIMRLLDIIQSVPGILLTIAISSAFGSGFDKTVLAIGLAQIPSFARILRAAIMNIRKMEYLEAAEAIGAKRYRIIFVHVLPNAMAPLIVSATMWIANTMLIAASLSFVGLGVQPPTPEWGAMLSAGRAYIRDYPHLVIFPGLFIAITVLGLNMFGDGLRDACDPKLKN